MRHHANIIVVGIDAQFCFVHLALQPCGHYVSTFVNSFLHPQLSVICTNVHKYLASTSCTLCGTPQGGVLSSRIWNLAFDPLLKLLNQNSPCAPVGFADDGALCFRGICAETLVDMAQLKINQAIEWGAQNGLSFSVDKTTVVFFSREKQLP